MRKKFDQYCPMAHALSLVGERWSLLIVRELLHGPKRYTDLTNGLPGIGTNILAARLRESARGCADGDRRCLRSRRRRERGAPAARGLRRDRTPLCVRRRRAAGATRDRRCDRNRLVYEDAACGGLGGCRHARSRGRRGCAGTPAAGRDRERGDAAIVVGDREASGAAAAKARGGGAARPLATAASAAGAAADGGAGNV